MFFGFVVWGSGFGVLGFGVQGSRFRVQGSGFRVQGSGSRVQGVPPAARSTAGAAPRKPPSPLRLLILATLAPPLRHPHSRSLPRRAGQERGEGRWMVGRPEKGRRVREVARRRAEAVREMAHPRSRSDPRREGQ